MTLAAAVLLSCLLDALLGDPARMPHPVVLMGRCIAWAERALRRAFPATPRGLRAAGTVLAAGLPLAVLALSAGALWLAGLVHPALRFALEVLWGWQALALRGLRDEALGVRRALEAAPLDKARAAVGRIVGRDTGELGREGVARAAVETVAENFCDGVVAPLLYLAAGGAPLALCYKAVNTMDSMVGYKNERYLHFGRAAARLDDAANWVPARLAALLLVAASFCAGPGRGPRGRAEVARRAARVWRRDRRNHASPNSAQTEAAMAGALGVRLGGPASYFGTVCDKPTIGDALHPVGPADVAAAARVMCAGGLLALAVVDGARVLAACATGGGSL